MSVFSRLLLATDLAPAADRALERAVRLAVENHGDLAVVCVRPSDGGGPLSRFGSSGIEAEIRRHVAAVPGALELAPVVRCLDGEIDAAIADFAARWRADLVVAGGGRAQASGLFAVSLVERLSVALPVPLLLVRRKPFAGYASALVPVDFAPPSQAAVQAARALVGHGTLTLLHVADLPSLGGVELPVRDHAEEFAALTRGIALDGLAVGHQLRQGVAMVEIAAAAQADPPDLIVMGTAGRQGITRALLGSTAHDVLEHLPCDVLLVKAA